jgi:hypothetical protein
MAEAPTDWLTLTEAIRAYGRSERTMRRLLTAGHIQGQQYKGPFGPEWRIQPPARPASAAATQPAAAPGSALLPIGEVERLLAPLLDERETLREELAAERAARLADVRTMGQLEGELKALQAELDRLRQQGPQPGPSPASDPPPRRRWPWSR